MFEISRCPLCNSTNALVIDVISNDTITNAYINGGLIDSTTMASAGKAADRPVSLCQCATCDLRWYSNAEAGDSALYEHLQKQDWYYQKFKPEYLEAEKWISENSRVIEVGCGDCHFGDIINSRTMYSGIDLNSVAISRARARGLNAHVRTVESEARTNPGSYDVVCSFQVLEHVTDPNSFLAACASCLDTKGTLIIAVPSEDSFVGLASNAWLNMPPHHLTRWSDSALRYSLEQVGISVVEVWHEPVAEYHKSWHETAELMTGLRRLLHKPTRLTHNKLERSMVEICRRVPLLSKQLSTVARKFEPRLSNGHTVMIRGRKQ